MQDNNITIRYKIQEVKIIKQEFVKNEFHIYGIRKDKRNKKEYRIKDYRTVKILIDFHNDIPIYLHLKKQRYISKITGKIITSNISIVEKNCRISNNIKDDIRKKLKDIKTFKQNAKEHNVSINTVIRILDNIKLKENKFDTSVIFIDEFKGNLEKEKYQLAVYDKNHKLINIYKNRHQSTLKKVLLEFKPDMVVTDMFKPFRNVINKTLPNANIVSDKYHVIRQGIWTIRDIRINLFNSDSEKYKEFKKYWKVIQKNPKNLKDTEKIIIDRLKAQSDIFSVAYDLIKKFYELFELSDIQKFSNELNNLILELNESDILKCKTLANTLNSWFKEIVNIIQYGYNNGFVEGFNNKIKVIKRIGYGYRNYERFNKLMKIRLQA
ncbi:MAG: ISL3 family transposase [Treponema sp.]